MINQPLTALFKQIILDNRLYDTGALHSSIQVETIVQGPNISIIVNALDYIKFHITDYDLTGQFTNNSTFTNEIGNLIVIYTQTELFDMLKSGIDPNFDYKIKLQYNLYDKD